MPGGSASVSQSTVPVGGDDREPYDAAAHLVAAATFRMSGPGSRPAAERRRRAPPRRPLSPRPGRRRVIERMAREEIAAADQQRDGHQRRQEEIDGRDRCTVRVLVQGGIVELVADAAHREDQLGLRSSRSTRVRRRRTWTSTVRGSTYVSRPQTRSSSWVRSNTRFGMAHQERQQLELAQAELDFLPVRGTPGRCRSRCADGRARRTRAGAWRPVRGRGGAPL